MWTPTCRRAADRKGLHYPSDLTDAEGAFVALSGAMPRRALAVFSS